MKRLLRKQQWLCPLLAVLAAFPLGAIDLAAVDYLNPEGSDPTVLVGPYRHVVTGSSIVNESRSFEGVTSANLTGVPLHDNNGDRLGIFMARLLWMGSGVPDTSVELEMPNGQRRSIEVSNADCIVQRGSEEVAELSSDFQYFICDANVKNQIVDLLVDRSNINGQYTMRNFRVDTGDTYHELNGGENVPGPNDEYAGAWTLAIVYTHTTVTTPRQIQMYKGMRFTQRSFRNVSNPLQSFRITGESGKLTFVALEGDREYPSGGCPNASAGVTSSSNNACDFLVLCNGRCNEGGSPVIATFADGGANPLGNTFNETVSSDSAVNPTGTNSFDLDTFDFIAHSEVTDNGQIRANVHVGVQTGADLVAHTLMIIEVSDADTDEDGLSDLTEDPNNNDVVDPGETDPTRPDTDGDGLLDGTEVNGGLPGDPNSSVTNPLNPDSDGDGLCDGPLTVVGTCVGGEDINGNGVIDPGETDPNNPDTDGDGLSDGQEVLSGNYSPENTAPGDIGSQTDPLLRDSDGDGLCDGPDIVVNGEVVCPGEDQNGNGTVNTGETDPTIPEGGTPTDPDSDGDGIRDSLEDPNGNGILDPGENSSSTDPDTDDDGLCDGPNDVPGECYGRDPVTGELVGEDRNANGVLDFGETDPNNNDSDGDSLTDGQEVLGGTYDDIRSGVQRGTQTDPLDEDTDGDGLCDSVPEGQDYTGLDCGGGEDSNRNNRVDDATEVPYDRLPEEGVRQETNPASPDTDGDGLCDGLGEFNTDTASCEGDDIGEDTNTNSLFEEGETNPRDNDTDDDSLSDGFEVLDGRYPAGGTFANGEAPGEFDTRTNPLNPDTDGDGFIDSAEDANSNGVLDANESDPTDFDELGVAGSSILGTCAHASGSTMSMFGLLGFFGLAIRRRRD